MKWLFSIVIDRLRALFIADLALELESQALSREMERKAELFLQAERYRKQGLDALADSLQKKIEELDFQKPLAGVLPALEHWNGEQSQTISGSQSKQNGSETHRLFKSQRKQAAKRK